MTTYKITHLVHVDVHVDDERSLDAPTIQDLADDMSLQTESLPDASVLLVNVEEVDAIDVEFAAAHGEPDHELDVCTPHAPCQHVHVERREKFDGTPYWVCLDCGADSWEGPPRVIPPAEKCPVHGYASCPAEAVPVVHALSITTNGQAIRVAVQDSTEGIATLLAAREIDAIVGSDFRIYYDANAATDARPVNDHGTQIAETLLGESLTLDDDGSPLRGPILIAGRPALGGHVLEVVDSIVPSFDFAGRW
jgi:hypothetical protein